MIHQLGDRLLSIEGIVAIALDGSRARSNHPTTSDVVTKFM
ncbi:MAG: hypothetical protein NW224_01130 [Leptolyngbyaceae cyanobacterium bins.302]|nr:hypothetical protein [Leptolyngbyaceae cyanobacterium bins.302]